MKKLRHEGLSKLLEISSSETAELDLNAGSLAPGARWTWTAGVWWEEGKELIISEAGSYSWRISSLESDKPMVAQLLCLSFLICKTEMTVPTSQSSC